jgi:hypothetical protein
MTDPDLISNEWIFIYDCKVGQAYSLAALYSEDFTTCEINGEKTNAKVGYNFGKFIGTKVEKYGDNEYEEYYTILMKYIFENGSISDLQYCNRMEEVHSSPIMKINKDND